MINKEVKQNWLEALRSGRYQQTTDALKDEGGYCCLGVLCDILAGVKGEWSEEDEDVYTYKNQMSSTDLPTYLREELGIPDDVETELVEMNDSGRSFDVIAEFIEASL